MNAQTKPSLLSLPQEMRELIHRIAEAALLDAAMAARGDTLSMRQRGHQCAAEARETAASAVQRIDINKLVAEFTGQLPDVAEIAAFETAAIANHSYVLRDGKGEYVHPATKRAYAIWQAAVRWARNQAAEPP